MNFYNEIDDGAAAILRELISRGLIAPGVVDQRSIEDITPNELKQYTQCHFFAGIGVWSLALRRAGWPDDKPVWTGSCPCQPFSAAGKGDGFADERHLWPAWHHLIAECKPDHIFGEQVASKDGLGWLDLVQSDMEAEGYAFGAVDLCAAGVGAPHIRQRLYFAADRLMADADDARLEGRWQPGRGRAVERAAGSGGVVGGMGLADRDGSQPGRQGSSAARQGGAADPAGSAGRLGNPGDVRLVGGQRRGSDAGAAREVGGPVRHERLRDEPVADVGGAVGLADAERDAGRGEAEPSDHLGAQAHGPADRAGGRGGSLGRMEHALHVGWQRGEASASGHDDDGTAPEWAEGEHGAGVADAPGLHRQPAGPTNGHWRVADWLLCRDAKWRPVEPGTFPLAHGAPARVGRLRGYGNAIVAQAAEAFIASYLEARGIEFDTDL